jgi:ABC-type sugar transport system substrate-binding protein
LWVSNSRPTGETEKIVIGASLLTQQHPFYMLLADAMKKEVEIDGVSLQLSIANKDLKKQLSDVEDFITKGVRGAMYSFT